MTELILESLPRLLSGSWVTVQLTALSVFFGIIIAVPAALIRSSPNKFLNFPVHCFTFYFRGTPLLVQIYLVYYGSGQFFQFLQGIGLWTFFQEAYFCAVLTLTLNTAAYTAEILRGGIEAVPFGEIEAARACGMSKTKLYRRIIMPKAFRIAWPAYTNEVIFLLQATSLVSIITVMDITGVARVLSAKNFAFYEIFLTASALYLVLVYGVLFIFKTIEKRITNHLRQPMMSE